MQPVRRFCSALALAALVALSACGGSDQEFLGRPLSEWDREIDSDNRQDRLSAVRAIGEVARQNPANAAAIQSLRRALSHDDRAVRHWAVRSVAAMGEAASSLEGNLHEKLADEITDVRVWAAYALCRLGKTEEALPVLAEALADANGGARLHAAHALEALGENARPVAEALRGVLGDDFGYPDRVAGRVLENLGEQPSDAAQD